jgi:hypothetical protein
MNVISIAGLLACAETRERGPEISVLGSGLGYTGTGSFVVFFCHFRIFSLNEQLSRASDELERM